VQEAKLIRLLAVFIVAFCLGGYASLYILSEYVIDIKENHEAALKRKVSVSKFINTQNAEPLIKASNMLARYSVCELGTEEGDAVALVLSMNSFYMGLSTSQSSEVNLDTVFTGSLLTRELNVSTPKIEKLNELIGKYCEEKFIKCEKFENLNEKKLMELGLKCT